MKMRRAQPAIVGVAIICLVAACSHITRPQAAPPPVPAFVPWLPLAATGRVLQPPSPSPVPPVAIPSGTPPCNAGQLEGRYIGGGGAAGHIDSSVAFRNRSGRPCYLLGYPDITIVDASGHVIAQAVGAAQRGTFFDDPSAPPVPALMSVGALPLGASEARVAVVGEAHMNIEWFDCSAPRAASLLVDLPENGGRLAIGYAITAPSSPACGNSIPQSGLWRGPIIPYGYSGPPQPVLMPMAILMDAPASVKRGTTLVYYVTLSNVGTSDYSLGQCPDYLEALTNKNPIATYELNCGPVGNIPPGASDRFQMRLEIPTSVTPGPNTLLWSLTDFRIDTTNASVQIEVT